MKYFKTALCLALVCVVLSGCSFRFSSSIDDLISPPSPFGDNADIKDALDAYVQNGYSLKTPNSGEYIASYSFFDVDGDGTEEAFAFYEPSDNLGTIDMALIRKGEEGWSVAEKITGIGREVHSVEFTDLDGDKTSELIVCWDSIPNSTNHELCIYKLDLSAENIISQLEDSISVNNYCSVDMYGGGDPELLLFEIYSGSTNSVKAELYSFEDGYPELIGETKLDSHITSYESLKAETVDGYTRVYADALGSDGSSMLTELVYWSNAYKTIICPFYSYSTGRSKDTIRQLLVPSYDVNDDGIIEIPLDYEASWNTDTVAAVEWTDYKHSVLMHTAYSIFVPKERYIVVISDDYIDKINAEYNAENSELTVTSVESGNVVFSIMPVLKATYSSDKYLGYVEVAQSNGYCYLAKQGNDDIKITTDELSSLVKFIDN